MANPSLGNDQIFLAEEVKEDYNRLKIVGHPTSANYTQENFPAEEHYFLLKVHSTWAV